MACLQQQNIEAIRLEKLTKYTQLAYELRERRPGYKITVIPLIIGALGGGMKSAMVELWNVLKKNELAKQVAGEMQKTILMDSESTIRKVLSRLREVSFFTRRGGLWKIFKFCKFLVIPLLYE